MMPLTGYDTEASWQMPRIGTARCHGLPQTIHRRMRRRSSLPLFFCASSRTFKSVVPGPHERTSKGGLGAQGPACLCASDPGVLTGQIRCETSSRFVDYKKKKKKNCWLHYRSINVRNVCPYSTE